MVGDRLTHRPARVAATLVALVALSSSPAIAQASPVGPDSTPCCGGGGYPSNSPYYGLAQWTDPMGNDTPLRKGDSTFGYAHYATQHGLPGYGMIGTAIQLGSGNFYGTRMDTVTSGTTRSVCTTAATTTSITLRSTPTSSSVWRSHR